MVHVIFSTKDRAELIPRDIQPRLWQYMGGLAREEFGAALQVGGIANHVHGLLSLRPDVPLSHAMNRWKSLSSGWMHRTFPAAGAFAWQGGYAAFSVSESAAAKVVAYIREQEKHYRKRTFEEEFVEFLRRHNVPYDPRYVWS
jgi:REP element-mobilizing transposase RayT